MSRNRTTRTTTTKAPEAAAPDYDTRGTEPGLAPEAAQAPTLAQAEKAQPAPSTRQDAIKAALAAAEEAEKADKASKASRAEKAAHKAEKAPRGPTLLEDAIAILTEAGRDLPVAALVEALRALRPTIGQDAKAAKAARAEADAAREAEAIARERSDTIEADRARDAAREADYNATKAAAAQAKASIAAALYTAAKAGTLTLVARGVIGRAKAA